MCKTQRHHLDQVIKVNIVSERTHRHHAPPFVTHRKEHSTILGGIPAKNAWPEHEHEEILGRLRLKVILQNEKPSILKSIKDINDRENLKTVPSSVTK